MAGNPPHTQGSHKRYAGCQLGLASQNWQSQPTQAYGLKPVRFASQMKAVRSQLTQAYGLKLQQQPTRRVVYVTPHTVRGLKPSADCCNPYSCIGYNTFNLRLEEYIINVG